MRSSTPGAEEKLKSDLLSAKKARKKAKTAYKNFKAKLKPFKQALKEAEKAEKLAKAALKSTQGNAPATTTAEAPAAPKKRGRQPGYSPKAAKAAAAAPKAMPSKKPATSTSGGDDLTQVKGVGENIAVMLKANGVTTFADMAATSFDRYKELLKANGMSKFRDPSQWAARAAEIAKMPAPKKAEPKAAAEPAAPKKRGRQPGFSPKATKAAKSAKAPAISHEAHLAELAKAAAKVGGDDLTQVKGVGDNIAVMLKANGVATYADMAATSFDRYKELLKANGMSKFRDPSQWAARAAVLVNAPAEPVAEPKKRGRQPGFSPKAKAEAAPKVKVAVDPNAAPKKRGRQPGYSPKAAKAAASAPVATAVKEAPAKAPSKPKGPPAKPDDLTQVKGVGQRVADALNKEGIYTYRDMAEVNLDRYKEILKDNNMSKFRDPSNWASIASELAGKK